MEKINFKANLSLTEIIRSCFQFVKLEGKTLLGYYLRFVLPLFIPVAYLTYQSDLYLINEVLSTETSQLEEVFLTLEWENLWFAVISQALVWIVFLTITLIYLKSYCNNNSKDLSNKAMWNELLYEFPKVFIVQFLYISIIFFGLASFIIPGIYFGVSLALTATIVVFENSKIFQGIRKSFMLIGTKWFMSLGYLLTFYIVYVVARIVLQLPISIIGSSMYGPDEMTKLSFTVISTLNAIVNMLASIFPIIGSVFLYYTLQQHQKPLNEDK